MRSSSMTTICVATAMMAFCVCHAAGSEPSSGLPVIIPSPRHMAWAESNAPGWLDLSAIKAIVVPPDCRDVAGGIDQFHARLRELKVTDALIPPPDFESSPSVKPGFIHLGIAPNAEIESRVAALAKPAAEGYRLLVDKDAVFILGSDLPGLYHGLMTLRQLVDNQGRVARVAISDWPDLPLRGTYIAGNTGLEARILQCAALKLNLMLFECGDFFDFEDAAKRTR